MFRVVLIAWSIVVLTGCRLGFRDDPATPDAAPDTGDAAPPACGTAVICDDFDSPGQTLHYTRIDTGAMMTVMPSCGAQASKCARLDLTAGTTESRFVYPSEVLRSKVRFRADVKPIVFPGSGSGATGQLLAIDFNLGVTGEQYGVTIFNGEFVLYQFNFQTSTQVAMASSVMVTPSQTYDVELEVDLIAPNAMLRIDGGIVVPTLPITTSLTQGRSETMIGMFASGGAWAVTYDNLQVFELP